MAIDHACTGRVPATIINEVPDPLPCSVPPSIRILRRCTLYLSDPSQNHRLSSLAAAYDILALRPTTEAALQQACQTLECDIVSLDLSQRFNFYFKHKQLSAALQRGVRFEICYAPGIQNNDGGASKRNLISNATQLIRATRGRGIVISSEAKQALACRGPADLVNLAVLWGLPQDRAREALSKEARYVVIQAETKRQTFRGIVKILRGGTATEKSGKPIHPQEQKEQNKKRKIDAVDAGAANSQGNPPAISKRARKRQAKEARLNNSKTAEENKQPELNGNHRAEVKESQSLPTDSIQAK